MNMNQKTTFKIIRQKYAEPEGKPLAVILDVGKGTAMNFVYSPEAVKLDILILNSSALIPFVTDTKYAAFMPTRGRKKNEWKSVELIFHSYGK